VSQSNPNPLKLNPLKTRHLNRNAMTRHLKTGALLLMLAGLSACGRQIVEFGLDDAGADAGAVDAGTDGGTPATPPTVTATHPVDMATGVVVNTYVSATFSKAMDPSTITAANFTVKQGATPVTGLLSLDSITNTATFTPEGPLANSLVYTATVTTGVKDMGGLALKADHVWTFTTADTAPTVTANTPLDGATNVAINENPTATFSRAMDPASINPLTFTVKQGQTPVSGKVTIDAANTTASFLPDAMLGNNLVYTATITTGAKDANGLALAANYVWTFVTAAVTPAPTVTSTTPLDQAMNVSAGEAPTATFSTAMDPTTIGNTTFLLSQGSTPVMGNVTFNSMTRTATFTPNAPLQNSLLYTATITTGARDMSGLALTANYVWSFTTANAAVAPTVTSTNPLDQANGVPINTKLTATFSTAMDANTINSQTFTVAQGLMPVTGQISLDALTNTATFTPDAMLGNDLTYTATITTGAKDANGTPLAANHVWSFSTGSTALMITSTTPLNNATYVSIAEQPRATFNKAMDPATISAQTFTLAQGLTPVLGTVALDTLGTTAIFTPNNPLDINLLYTATITTGAKDLKGQSLANNYVWSFKTAACSQAPINLLTAANFAVLGGSTVTNTGMTIVIGDLGVSPGTQVTGFGPGAISGAQHAGDTVAAQGIADLTTAYNEAAGRTLCPVTVAGNLGGQTLPPGLYKSTSSLSVTSGDLTLDAQGDSDAVFIFQTASTLTTTAGRQVILSGGAKASNIFWQVGSSATLGTTSVFQGTIMADQAISLDTGASLTGRALARIAAVTLDTNQVTRPAP
jgi:hypothetical protein